MVDVSEWRNTFVRFQRVTKRVMNIESFIFLDQISLKQWLLENAVYACPFKSNLKYFFALWQRMINAQFVGIIFRGLGNCKLCISNGNLFIRHSPNES